MSARDRERAWASSEALSNSAHGRFVHNILADTAEFYRENLAEEVMKGLSREAQEGGGFSVSRVILDPERADIVRWTQAVARTIETRALLLDECVEIVLSGDGASSVSVNPGLSHDCSTEQTQDPRAG